jgi:6-phosphofructokinase 1
VAEGAHPAAGPEPPIEEQATDTLKGSLSPNATGQTSSRVIHRSGHVAETVALQIQRLTDFETYPLVLGQLVKGGAPTAVDRQLGLSYGAAAVQALQHDQTGVMVAFEPPELTFVPLCDAINKIRTVPPDSVFMKVSRSLGICFGDEVSL